MNETTVQKCECNVVGSSELCTSNKGEKGDTKQSAFKDGSSNHMIVCYFEHLHMFSQTKSDKLHLEGGKIEAPKRCYLVVPAGHTLLPRPARSPVVGGFFNEGAPGCADQLAVGINTQRDPL